MRKFILLFFISFVIFAKEPLSFVFSSKYDLKTTVSKIQASIKGANYRTYKPKKLLESLIFKKDISKQVVIRFCNFDKMQQFIKVEKRLGVLLPCRITVVEGIRGEVSVVIENYKRTVLKFNNPQISKEAENLIEELFEIIKESLW